MIKSITMKNVGSYKEETKLYLNTPITLIYGNNGAGKTLLSNYLYNINNDIYKECSIDGLDITNDNILVYNQKFIEENFYIKKEQQGIFTISKENKEINEKIENTEKLLAEELLKEKTLSEQIITLNQDLENKTNKLKNIIYEFKQKYAKKDIFKKFFIGISISEPFFDYIYKLNKFEDTSTIDELEQQLRTLTDYNEINLINIEDISNCFNTFNSIEQNSIFNEIIVGSSNAVFSAIINKLDNADWVEKGYKEYLPKSNDICPFCQQEINLKDLTTKIEKYFDKNYIENKNILLQLQKQYENNYQILNQYISNLYTNTYIEKIEKNYSQEIKNIYYEIQKVIEYNINIINSKLANMSSQVTLPSSIEVASNLIQLLNIINEKIKEHNIKVNNVNNEKEKIKNKFFNICRKQYDTEITMYTSEKEKIENDINIIKEKIISSKTEIDKYNNQLQSYRTSTKNSFESVDNINGLLQEMGILNFKLGEVDNNFYKIIRDNEETEIFSTLSEGEKMIISFLYFIEKCKGIINDDEINKNKLIVIDDPISSLSFEHIFTIASIIKHSVIEELINKTNNKIIILTHNLYFFHEFNLPKKLKLNELAHYRIYKDINNNSIIKETRNEDDIIMNEYQALWKVLQDYKNNKCNKIVIPNTIRNIIEYFASFIYNDDYKKIVDDEKIYNKVFIRYINRNSHHDKKNIINMNDIDMDIFMENFKHLFKDWGYEEHYKIMMGINNKKNSDNN